MNFEKLFGLSLSRNLPDLIDPPEGLRISLGETGVKSYPTDLALGLPGWRWPQDPIPAEDGSAGIVHAYHFLEHLSGDDAIAMLIEVQRVLKVGGVFQFAVPWYGAELQAQDLTHKSSWSESSFRILMRNDYYDPSGGKQVRWLLKQHYLVIAGIVGRNLMVIGQLVKIADEVES